MQYFIQCHAHIFINKTKSYCILTTIITLFCISVYISHAYIILKCLADILMKILLHFQKTWYSLIPLHKTILTLIIWVGILRVHFEVRTASKIC